MSISIEKIRSATPGEWDNIWKECDYSTYFHSREWAEIWNVYTNGKMCPDPKLLIFTDKKKALLPLSYQRSLKGYVKNYISSPAGTFGGWISTDELTVEHGKQLANYLTENHRNLVWRLNPYDNLVTTIGINVTGKDETHTLSLLDGFETIYKKWTKGHSSAVHKARREGVLIKQASRIEDWHAYFCAYEDSIKRWGEKVTSQYTLALFEDMFKRNSDHIKLWLALYDDTVIAGALVFYAKKHVVYWHGAAMAQYFNLRPTNLLMYEIIKHACEQRYSWFDFNPSGGHEGVKAFKRSFGAESLPCNVVFKQDLRTYLFNQARKNCYRVAKLLRFLTPKE